MCGSSEKNLYTLHPRICGKLGWNLLGGSGREIFFNSSMYFRNFVMVMENKMKKLYDNNNDADGQQKNFDQKSPLEPSAEVS